MLLIMLFAFTFAFGVGWLVGLFVILGCLLAFCFRGIALSYCCWYDLCLLLGWWFVCWFLFCLFVLLAYVFCFILDFGSFGCLLACFIVVFLLAFFLFGLCSFVWDGFIC